MIPDDLQIQSLVEDPEPAGQVADWIEAEWGSLPIHLYFDAIACRRGWEHPLPVTYVASLKGRPVGTASLLLDDLETRTELNPWFGCLFVEQSHRRQGIGTALMLAVEAAAQQRLGIGHLYLFTESNRQLYARHGWRFLEADVYKGKPISIMDKYLKQPAVKETSEP